MKDALVLREFLQLQCNCEKPVWIIQSIRLAPGARAYYTFENILVIESYTHIDFFTSYVAFHISLTSFAHNESQRCVSTASNGSMTWTSTTWRSSSISTCSTTCCHHSNTSAGNRMYATAGKTTHRWSLGASNNKLRTTEPSACANKGKAPASETRGHPSAPRRPDTLQIEGYRAAFRTGCTRGSTVDKGKVPMGHQD